MNCPLETKTAQNVPKIIKTGRLQLCTGEDSKKHGSEPLPQANQRLLKPSSKEWLRTMQRDPGGKIQLGSCGSAKGRGGLLCTVLYPTVSNATAPPHARQPLNLFRETTHGCKKTCMIQSYIETRTEPLYTFHSKYVCRILQVLLGGGEKRRIILRGEKKYAKMHQFRHNTRHKVVQFFQIQTLADHAVTDSG